MNDDSPVLPCAHVEPCRCPPPPRCVSCGHDMAKAEPHPVCQRTDGALVGVWQLAPDMTPAPATSPPTGESERYW